MILVNFEKNVSFLKLSKLVQIIGHGKIIFFELYSSAEKYKAIFPDTEGSTSKSAAAPLLRSYWRNFIHECKCDGRKKHVTRRSSVHLNATSLV